MLEQRIELRAIEFRLEPLDDASSGDSRPLDRSLLTEL